mgnify:CR=1 FL=1
MAFYSPRNITPADQILFDANGDPVGIQPAGSSQPPLMGFNPTKHAAIDSLVSGAWTRVNLRDWNGFDNTGNNSMLSIMQAAQQQLETFGSGRIELERGTYAMDGNLTIRGGAPTLNGGYQGGIELVGQHMVDTVLQFSSGGIIDLIFTVYAIFSGGIVGIFLLGVFSARANRQGVNIGIIACILFTSWAFLTSTPIGIKNPKLLLDLGNFNFTHHKLMLGVYSHLIVIVVGYIASLFFPKPVLQQNLLYSSWKQNRNNENAQ